MKRLVGRTDMEDALKRLDKLTQEEARMVVAENLKATRAVDERVKGIANTMTAMDNRVAGMDGQVASIDARVASVNDRVKVVDEKVGEIIHGEQIIFSHSPE
jgi:predicted  nucleic acid-binding Zn-ribbon protein